MAAGDSAGLRGLAAVLCREGMEQPGVLSDAGQSSLVLPAGRMHQDLGEWELLSLVTVLWVCYVRLSCSRETFIR